MRRHIFIAGLLALASALPAGAADEKTPLVKWLERSSYSEETASREVENFTEARVQPVPNVQSVAEWEEYANRARRATLDSVVYRGAAASWRDAMTKVEWLDTIPGGPGYSIRKLRYEALPGMWIPALLYVPEKLAGKVPVVLNVNGHDRAGKAADYKQLRCINQAKRGMLALNIEWLGMGQLNVAGMTHARMNQLDLCGASGLAPFYLSMKRGLDILLAHENADPQRVAVAGLSGGGWQTIIISALDTRVTLSNPVAGYSGFKTRIHNDSDLGDSEQTPVDLAMTADYAVLTALRAPRPTLLTFNAQDQCCFKADHALPPLLAAAGPIFKLYGKEQNLRSHVNEVPGDHNFGLDNRQALYAAFGDFFYQGDAAFSATEIDSAAEVKTKDELQVEIPAANEDFNSLALKLSGDLPRNKDVPADRERVVDWQKARRIELADILRTPRYNAAAEASGMEEADGTKAVFWKLKLASDWTLSAIELSRGTPTGTSLVIADEGHAGQEAQAAIAKLLENGQRVVTFDPFYFGESRLGKKAYLFALLTSAVGQRPLGVQAGQVGSVARWLRAEYSDQPLSLVAIGPRTSVIALSSAAIETEAIQRVVLQAPLGSLKLVIEESRSFDQSPELFCFGLLEKFDMVQLGALIAPRPIKLIDPSDRAQQELATLAVWYERFGMKFDPLPE